MDTENIFILIKNKRKQLKTMKRFNYFCADVAVTKAQFEKNVPDNWEDELDEQGCYSYGYYKAIEIDNKEDE